MTVNSVNAALFTWHALSAALAKSGPLDFPSKMIFGKTTPVVAIESVKFQKFCPARSDCNNVAHGIISFYKLQDVFS